MSKDKGLQGGSREFPRSRRSGSFGSSERLEAQAGVLRGTAPDSAGEGCNARPAARPARKWLLDPENMHVHHHVLLLASLHRMEKRGSIP